VRRPSHDAHVAAYLEHLGRYIRARSIVEEDTGCWLWRYCVNCRDGTGVPVATLPGTRKATTVRKLSAVVAGRWLSEIVATSCKERLCVAPEHMLPCTRAELARTMVKDGRILTGPTFSARRLAAARAKAHVVMTIEKARAVRARYAEIGNAKAVALEFGLKHDHAHKIIRGKLWREPSPFQGLGA